MSAAGMTHDSRVRLIRFMELLSNRSTCSGLFDKRQRLKGRAGMEFISRFGATPKRRTRAETQSVHVQAIGLYTAKAGVNIEVLHVFSYTREGKITDGQYSRLDRPPTCRDDAWARPPA